MSFPSLAGMHERTRKPNESMQALEFFLHVRVCVSLSSFSDAPVWTVAREGRMKWRFGFSPFLKYGSGCERACMSKMRAEDGEKGSLYLMQFLAILPS